MTTSAHTHTADLPLGYRCTFIWDGTAFSTCWEPDSPWDTIRSHRRKRRLLRAYVKARDDFLQDLAMLIGGSIAIITRGDPGITLVQPATRQ
jgi:hypothetical protein